MILCMTGIRGTLFIIKKKLKIKKNFAKSLTAKEL